MKDDKIILIFIIVNIIVLMTIGMIIASKHPIKKNEKIEPIIKEATDGVKTCRYSETANNIRKNNEIQITFSNSLVDKYSIYYNVHLNNPLNEDLFINERIHIESLVNLYQGDNEIEITDYDSQSDSFSVRVTHNLKDQTVKEGVIIEYQQPINEAVTKLKELGYICG